MKTSIHRRVVLQLAVGGLCGAAAVRAQAAQVDEADETAVALGYRHDTNKVDAKKFANHSPSQHCANCGFWQGAASDAWAGCSMFGRKQVAHGGWCAAWRKP
ncbi:MAG TPA: high-potential iron-sulfur protein [Ideonella sp.]|jgi:hypothetical protein|nr:high-potential iron-sulfur protein [Ideonella sp.]